MLTALLIWLGWQMVVSLLVERSPVEIAVRVAPGSGQTLSRAAEAELVAGRFDSARELATMALRTVPFDVRALRVLGLAVAETDRDAADELLTLAGNWSLRDDPAHAWLIQRRLEQGDYGGAFGHADALARRREDLRPRLFRLFTVAVAEDPRAVPFLLPHLAASPNWRAAYFEFLRRVPEGPQVQAILAEGLQRTDGPLTRSELQTIYLDWVDAGRFQGVRELRRRLRRPPPTLLQDGDFDSAPTPAPFTWTVETGPGASAEISEHVEAQGKALFVQTDGFSSILIASQLLQLDPGFYNLKGRMLFEAGGRDPRLSWSVRCFESGEVLAVWLPSAPNDRSGWLTGRTAFSVPSENCTAQSLELTTQRGPRRTVIIAWFDGLSLVHATERAGT